MLTTEMNSYRHAKTKDYETVELICNKAYLQIVLPNEQMSLDELEAKLIQDDGSLESSLKSEVGDVEIPAFSFKFQTDVRQALERLGIRRVFETTNSLAALIQSPDGAMLKGIWQEVQINVNEQGISANAKTITSGVYGGILGGQYVPFHMVVNRPFIFFVRDNVTDSLLFAGAVGDPGKY